MVRSNNENTFFISKLVRQLADLLGIELERNESFKRLQPMRKPSHYSNRYLDVNKEKKSWNILN